MQKMLTPQERLIVAADFKPTAPNGREWVRREIISLARDLKGTGVVIKVNSALRACGYNLIQVIQSNGLQVFADLKLYDISETLAMDGALLREVKPELLTVSCLAEVEAMKALKAQLPHTEVLGVTVLTSHTLKICIERFGVGSIEDAAVMLAELAVEAGLDGVISSAKEAPAIRKILLQGMTINCPAIRPTWAIVSGDDQNPDRIVTPLKAVEAGADRIVVGRPIIQAPSRYRAIIQTVTEIASALA